ncbi:MAG TPA: hypothetical protein VIT91_12570 [Chthoniobacterales bacterium]
MIRVVQELSGEWPRFGDERIQPGASVEEAIISSFPSILMVVQACGPRDWYESNTTSPPGWLATHW